MSLFGEQDLWPGTNTDQELLSDPIGFSIPPVTTGYNPGWTALDHGDEAGPRYPYDTQVKIESQPVYIELGPTSNSPPTEASTAEFLIREHTDVSQTQPRGTGEHGTTQNTRPRRRKRTVQYVCVEHNTLCSRLQEFKRHLREVHQPRRQCPFCDFMWVRPDKIKTHLVAKHQDRLSPEMLADIKPLKGLQMAAFVDGFVTDPYDQGLGVEATFPSLVLQDVLPVLM